GDRARLGSRLAGAEQDAVQRRLGFAPVAELLLQEGGAQPCADLIGEGREFADFAADRADRRSGDRGEGCRRSERFTVLAAAAIRRTERRAASEQNRDQGGDEGRCLPPAGGTAEAVRRPQLERRTVHDAL